ncbi:MAG: ribonuclease H family protein, partial [Bacteroidales bacterium]|nr:ribonuclease H family protein [Bacteroidales bacterium]
MGKKKQKYYVVWRGNRPGIYDSWEGCQAQVKGVAGAQYKSFETLALARAAYDRPYSEAVASSTSGTSSTSSTSSVLCIDENGMTAIREGMVNPPVLDALAVDAACSGNPGVMEYQGVYVASRTQIFHYKAPVGTNNIGEFLAIVHGLAYLKKKGLKQIIYSDSVNAINWVRRKECRTKLPLTPQTADLCALIRRAEAWLQANSYTTEIRKWDTDHWGEI